MTAAVLPDRSAPVRRWMLDHPVGAVALAALATVLLHRWWVLTNRPLGTVDVDEATYLVNALRFDRALFGNGPDGSGPAAFLTKVTQVGTGPLMPVLTVPVLRVLGRDLHAALLVPALFHALAAVGVTGIVANLGRRRAAVVAGLVVLALPAWLIAARSYTLAGPPAAVLAATVWALLASDRGRRWGPLAAAGVGIGVLTLSRTMAVAFVPGLVLAAVLVLRGTPRAVLRVAFVLAVATTVALPWWRATWDVSASYLFDYGYGEESPGYGPASLLLRVLQRVGVTTWDVRPLLLVPALVLAASVLRSTWRAAGRRPRRWAGAVLHHPEHLSVWAVIALGYLALLSTANSGVQFELALETLLVAALASVAHLASAPVRRGVLWVTVVAVALNLALVGNWSVGSTVRLGPGPPPFAASVYLFGDMYQPPTALQTAEPLQFSDRTERERLGAQWWRAHRRVRDATGDGADGLLLQGNGRLMNGNTLSLAAELSASPIDRLDVVATGDLEDPRWRSTLRDGHWHRAVIVRSADDLFLPREEDPDRVEAALRAEGWTTGTRVPLPDGGTAVVLVSPSP